MTQIRKFLFIPLFASALIGCSVTQGNTTAPSVIPTVQPAVTQTEATTAQAQTPPEASFPTFVFDGDTTVDHEVFWQEITASVAILNECYNETFSATVEKEIYYAAYLEEADCYDLAVEPVFLCTGDERARYTGAYHFHPDYTPAFYQVSNYQSVAHITEHLLQYVSQDVLDATGLTENFFEQSGALYLVRGEKGYGAYQLDPQSLTFLKQEGDFYHLRADGYLFETLDGSVDLTFAYQDGAFVLINVMQAI